MGRPPQPFLDLAERFVCVRVTDMRGVDLAQWRFDYDLTFAALLAHPDGTVYHRFGGRDSHDAMQWTSMDLLGSVMRETLVEHAAYAADPRPPRRPEPTTVSDLPTFADRDREQRVDCVHCHTVHDHQRESAQRAGKWQRDDLWIWPAPTRIGLHLDPSDPRRVVSVTPDSPAAAAGIVAGDELRTIGAQRVLTMPDVQAVLDPLPFAGADLAAVVVRDDAELEVEISLPAAWREETPQAFAWRPYKWQLSPAPGFGGPALTAAEKRELGLDPAAFAFRVQYLVNWGPRAAIGRSAAKAGLRTGDVVVAIDGRTDFESFEHFHAWVSLRKQVGETLTVRILRDGESMNLRIELVG